MKSESTEKSFPSPSDYGDIDPEIVRQAIRARAEDIKRRELQQAFNRLETCGTLTTAQRQIITQMATAIVDEMLTAPESMLTDASEHYRETVQTAVELFDPDGEDRR